ncbi:MAG: hypothetical protein IJL80_04080, partial [Treponema sp.]|nr:hypothetical protein [Treponema sp.]
EGMRGQAGMQDVLCFPDKSDGSILKIAGLLKARMSPGDAVLIKGSRGMALERLTKCLTDGGEDE